ncbi:hypothetical protein SRABI82_05571 [Priestia megaterium]|nr:hypothetical protein SRABI82_05571 [Priestia megaterium]
MILRWVDKEMEENVIAVFFSYILLGISLSAPVGPINIAQINKGIKNGFWNAWFVGIGAMFADIIMMTLIYLGIATYLTNPLAKLIMWTFGFFTLIYLGYESIKDASNVKIEEKSEKAKESPFHSLLSGFLIAISNPLNIVFWVGIYGSALTQAINTIGKQQALWYSGAIFLGIMSWDLTVATTVHFGRKRLNPRSLRWIMIIAGICLIGFGLNFGYQVMQNCLYLFR